MYMRRTTQQGEGSKEGKEREGKGRDGRV